MTAVLLVMFGVALTLIAQHIERGADRERRTVGLRPFGPARSNVRQINPPYDWERDE